jgi:hypothetical protein
VLCCLTSLPRLTVRQIQHTCMPTNVHQHRTEIQLSHKSIATDAHQPSDIDMYSAKPPSRATFHLTGMPSPPAALRPLVNRLNRTPTHRERAIKAEPMSPPSRPDNTFGQLAPACHQQPAMQNTQLILDIHRGFRQLSTIASSRRPSQHPSSHQYHSRARFPRLPCGDPLPYPLYRATCFPAAVLTKRHAEKEERWPRCRRNGRRD